MESKEYIERYIQDTVRRIPEKQRKGIEEDIQSLINDTIEEKAIDKNNVEEIKKILTTLGEPRKLAMKYKEKEEYLIGPMYYDNYRWVLKIVIAATLFGILVASFILPIVDNTMELKDGFVHFMSNAIWGIAFAFAIITVMFACVEKGYIKEQTKREWTVEDLPKITNKNINIKKNSVIAGIIFTVLVIILFNFAPQLMGMNLLQDGKLVSYPIFDLEILQKLLPIFNVAILLGMIRDIAKVIEGRYTKKLCFFIVVLNIISMLLCIVIFTQPNIINGDTIKQINTIFSTEQIENVEIIQSLFNHFANFFLGVLAFAFAMDTGEAIYRTTKYYK